MKEVEADMRVLLLILLAFFQVTVTEYLVANPDFYQLDGYTWETEEFLRSNFPDCLPKEAGT